VSQVIVDMVSELKAHARVVHRRVLTQDPLALRGMRELSEFARTPDAELCRAVRRRHCLLLVARRLGFRDWNHALAILTGSDSQDFGTLLYPSTCHGHWNIWSASYDEARSIRAAHGGYLLAYKRQFLIVDRYYVDSMGIDPDDPDWNSMGRDWIRPEDLEARGRLYRKLVHNALVMQTLQPLTA
jgi:hypothetical protein